MSGLSDTPDPLPSSGGESIGPPQGNPYSRNARREALFGEGIPKGVRRRLWRDSAMPDTGVLGSIMTGGGVLPSMGKGIVDSGLALARGAAWVGSLGHVDTSKWPQTVYDLMPEESANHLASRIARANIAGATDVLGAKVSDIGEVTGQMLTLLGGGAIGGAAKPSIIGGKIGQSAGKAGVVGEAAGRVAAWAKGGDLISKAARPFTLPGQAISKLGFPGAVVGARLAKVPQVAKWTKTAKFLPEMLGGATGFGLYNFVTQDGNIEERAGAMLHGAVAGAALAGLGKLANHVERQLLRPNLDPNRVMGLSKLGEEIRATRLKDGWGAIGPESQLFARGASTLIENTGFAMLDRGFWDAALSGDYEKATEIYVTTLPAALLARTGRLDAWERFRRQDPDMNNMRLRADILWSRKTQDPQPARLGAPKPDLPEGVGVPKVKGFDSQYQDYLKTVEGGKADLGGQKMIGYTQEAIPAGYEPPKPPWGPPPSSEVGSVIEMGMAGFDEPPGPSTPEPQPHPLDGLSEPLFHSGWDIPAEGVPPEGVVELELPGAGKVSLGIVTPAAAEPDRSDVVRSSMTIAARGATGKTTVRTSPEQAAKLLPWVSSDTSLGQSLQAVADGSVSGAQMELDGKDLGKLAAQWNKYAPVERGKAGEAAEAVSAQQSADAWMGNALDALGIPYERSARKGKQSPEAVALAKQVRQGAESKAAKEGAQELSVEVPAEVYAQVRGVSAKTDTVKMTGEVADEFVRDLAAITMMRRMSGAIRFGEEAWAGGPWIHDGGNSLITIGLDGQAYAKSYPAREGEAWAPVSIEPLLANKTAETEAQQRWSDLAHALRMTSAPNPGMDVMEAAIIAAINGPENSKSIQELNEFMDTVDPDVLANLITPTNIERVGMLIGKVGAGHMMAQDAVARLDETLQDHAYFEGRMMPVAKRDAMIDEQRQRKDAEVEGEVSESTDPVVEQGGPEPGITEASTEAEVQKESTNAQSFINEIIGTGEGPQFLLDATEDKPYPVYQRSVGANFLKVGPGQEDLVIFAMTESLDRRDDANPAEVAKRRAKHPNDVSLSAIKVAIPGNQGRGLGAKALDTFKALADKHNARLVGHPDSGALLGQETVDVGQGPLENWYRKHGFKPYEEHRREGETKEELVARIGETNGSQWLYIPENYTPPSAAPATGAAKLPATVEPAQPKDALVPFAEEVTSTQETERVQRVAEAEARQVEEAELPRWMSPDRVPWQIVDMLREGKFTPLQAANAMAARLGVGSGWDELFAEFPELRRPQRGSQPPKSKPKERAKWIETRNKHLKKSLLEGLKDWAESSGYWQRPVKKSAKHLAKPETLLTAIRQMGGIQRGGAARLSLPSNVAAEYGSRAKGLLTEGGMRYDHLAEALAEAGWFGPEGRLPDGGVPPDFDAVAALTDLLAQDLAGDAIYHPDDPRAMQKMAREEVERSQPEFGDMTATEQAAVINTGSYSAQKMRALIDQSRSADELYEQLSDEHQHMVTFVDDAGIDATTGKPFSKSDRSGEGGWIDVGAGIDWLLKKLNPLFSSMEKMIAVVKRNMRRVLEYAYEVRSEQIRGVLPRDTIAYEGRTVLARTRRLRGEAQHLFRPARKVLVKKIGWLRSQRAKPAAGALAVQGQPSKKVAWQHETVKLAGGRAMFMSWERLADKRRAPRDAEEAVLQDSWQEGLLYLWDAARMAGMTRVQDVGGVPTMAPLPARSTGVTPRLPGQDLQTVYEQHDKRREWFELLETLHPGQTTADKLQQSWESARGDDVQAADVSTELEHVRQLHNVPSLWKASDGTVYEMRSSDPLKVLAHIQDQQAKQIGVAETFGQDIEEKHRRQVMDPLNAKARQMASMAVSGASALTPQERAVMDAMQRPGVARRIKQVLEAAAREGVWDAVSGKGFEKAVREWFDIMQGKPGIEPSMIVRAVRNFDAAPRAFMTVKAPIYDAAELVAQPVLYAGVRRTMKALYKIYGGDMNPVEAVRHYERMGAISSKMTSLMFEDAKGMFGVAAKVVGKPGEMSERLKGAHVAATADAMLESWGKWARSPKSATRWLRKDAELLSEMAFSPQEQRDLLLGRASEDLKDKFRAELVQHATGRAEAGEGPRLTDNPAITAAVRFIRLMSNITGKIYNRLKIAATATKTHGITSRQAATAWGRFASMTLNRTALLGASSMALGIILTQLMRGDPERIGERLTREMIEQPTAVLKEGLRKQVLGGIIGTGIQATDQTSALRAVRGAVALVDIGAGFWQVMNKLGNDPKAVGAAAIEAVKQFHYAPAFHDFKRLLPRVGDYITAATTGENLSLRSEAIRDADRAYEFLRSPVGKDAGLFGIPQAQSEFAPTKTAEFYDTVDEAMRQFWIGAANGGNEEGIKRSQSVFQQAIDRGDKPISIAAWIRSRRVTSIIGNDKVGDFLDWVGPELSDGIAERTQALDNLAQAVGRMDAREDPEWDSRVEKLREHAQTGLGDWSAIVDEALDSASIQMAESGSSRGADMRRINTIAPVIASSPALIRRIFTSKKGELLARSDRPESWKARYVTGLLLKRAVARAAERMREERSKQ